MKRLLILFLVSFLNADVSGLISSIENLKKEKSNHNRQINSIYNPFLNYSNNHKDAKPISIPTKNVSNNSTSPLRLEVIFNNRAKIDSNWYKKGDKIGKIVVLKILSDRVILKKGTKKITLSIKSKNILKVAQ